MEVPHIPHFALESKLTESIKQLISAFRPDWNLKDVNFKVFTDGITNKLVGCFNFQHESDVILIRVNGNRTEYLIDRNKETENIKYLHAAGLAPALYGTFINGLVYEYVPGDVVTTVTCRQSNIANLIARRLATMHSLQAKDPVSEPCLWKVISKYISQIPEKFSGAEKQYRYDELFFCKPDLNAEYFFLKQELTHLNSPIVLCHNDLLLGNIIYNSEKNLVTFIDYEYTDFNYQAYDIANHFNEFAGVETVDYSLYPDEKIQRVWLRTYLEVFKSKTSSQNDVQVTEEEVERFRLLVEKFTLASHFFWAVWSLLQAEHSSIDFDFINYASIRFKEYYRRKKNIFDC